MDRRSEGRYTRVEINSYSDLYDFVKKIKKQYNLDRDTSDVVDELIYRWFSQQGVRALDSCYDRFNDFLEENDGFLVRASGDVIYAEWEKEKRSDN